MGQQRRILIAEDEAIIRMDLAEMLTEAGFDVVAAVADGQAALEQTEALRPDVVLMDVKMPRLDGISAAAVIVEKRLAAVVMLTAFSQQELVDQAVEAGAMAYVVKPYSSSDLLPAIAVAQSRYDQIVALEEEISDLQQRMAARKQVDRAKAILQKQLQLTEDEAFRWIQKTAMDLRLKKFEVAAKVIAELGSSATQTGPKSPSSPDSGTQPASAVAPQADPISEASQSPSCPSR